MFHGSSTVLQACQDGHEALEITMRENRSITRVFVASDWSLYVQVAHPFHVDHERVTLRDFGKALPGYMAALADMFRDDLDGPYCVAMAVRNLRRNPKVGWVFPNTDTVAAPPEMADRIDAPGLVKRFADAVVRALRYG